MGTHLIARHVGEVLVQPQDDLAVERARRDHPCEVKAALAERRARARFQLPHALAERRAVNVPRTCG
jgi:hypothetical protein